MPTPKLPKPYQHNLSADFRKFRTFLAQLDVGVAILIAADLTVTATTEPMPLPEGRVQFEATLTLDRAGWEAFKVAAIAHRMGVQP